MVKVGINGFGRIGRQVLRIGLKKGGIDFVAVNDLTDVKTLAYLFKYDTVHGGFEGKVEHDDKHLIIDGKKIQVLSERDPEMLPWGKLGVEIVVESTGLFRTRIKAEKHIKAGAKKVLVSAPCKCEPDESGQMCAPIKTIVLGVNEHNYDKNEDHIISNASCTTNCLAPVVKVLNDNFGIEKGLMTTIHSYTNDQKILDLPHKDLRRGRAAAQNIIPTTTGAAIAVTEVIPELKGRIDGMAMRVPTPCGSITDFVCQLKKGTSVEEINKLFNDVSKHHLKNVLEYTDEPIVSVDIINNPHSSIFDSSSTMMLDDNFVKVVAWYDNEWGYSNRIVDVLKIM